MIHARKMGILGTGFLSLILGAATITSPAASGPGMPIGGIVSVTVEKRDGRAFVNVVGDGFISEYMTRRLDSLPGIMVEIPVVRASFSSRRTRVDGPVLAAVTTQALENRIRLILETSAKRLPPFTTFSEGNCLSVDIGYPEEGKQDQTGPSDLRPAFPERTSNGRLRWKGNFGREAPLQVGYVEPERMEGFEGTPGGKTRSTPLGEALEAVENHDWHKAVALIEDHIQRFPEGKDTEEAYFLLAESYDGLYDKSPAEHASKIKEHYEAAIRLYPDSDRVAGALLRLGDLAARTNNYPEALAYLNLCIKRGAESPSGLRAAISKAHILRLRGKAREALDILNKVMEKHPPVKEQFEARMEIAKALYDLHSFKRSLHVLETVLSESPEMITQDPEILLYMGYNHYQLGQSEQAGENLLRYYNIRPHAETNHLVLTRIGDTYRDQGLTSSALKFYGLVGSRYPGSEGALISKIRIAELKETDKKQERLHSTLSLLGIELEKPGEIYQDIAEGPKGRNGMLSQLALLKLAVMHQKKGDLDRSLEALRKLTGDFPGPALGKDAEVAAAEILESILKGYQENREYGKITELYSREKGLFSLVETPEPYLIAARAFVHINRSDLALEPYEKADPLLPVQEKPADLLLNLARYRAAGGDLDGAVAGLDLLLSQGPDPDQSLEAYRIKAEILAKQATFRKAAENLSAALDLAVDPCDRVELLIELADVLSRDNAKQKALSSMREAEKLQAVCMAVPPGYLRRTGEIYLELGAAGEALSGFGRSLEAAVDPEDRIYDKFMMAHCLRLMKREEEALRMYGEISALDDPFWADLAREKIEEIEFNKNYGRLDRVRIEKGKS